MRDPRRRIAAAPDRPGIGRSSQKSDTIFRTFFETPLVALRFNCIPSNGMRLTRSAQQTNGE
jgi:hypothetical protein